jgi:cell wall-associated NlpC family hydrolase
MMVLFFLLCIIVSGCAHGPQPGYIADLYEIPQDPLYFTQANRQAQTVSDWAVSENIAPRYLTKYFLPWNTASFMYPKDTVYWGFDAFEGKELYAADGLPYPNTWFSAVQANANYHGFPSLRRDGLTVQTAHVRVLPTQEPVFYNPDHAGQGYPFDMMQNSVLWTNTPVQVVHRSRDKAWLLVQTAWVFGWVRAKDVAWVSAAQKEHIQKTHHLAVIKDGISLIDHHATFYSMAHIGALLAVDGESQHSYQIKIPARDAHGKLSLQSGLVPRGSVRPFPLMFSPENIAALTKAMMGQIYGWGGLYARRDCSASIRDLFAPFGLWLPRNSSQQAKAGQVIDLSGLSAAAKEKTILRQGTPFSSLLWKPGHIMLYIGRHKGRPVIWHTMWGVKTRKILAGEGRHVVGRTVITSLRPGAELHSLARPDGLLVNGLEKMIRLCPALFSVFDSTAEANLDCVLSGTFER